MKHLQAATSAALSVALLLPATTVFGDMPNFSDWKDHIQGQLDDAFPSVPGAQDYIVVLKKDASVDGIAKKYGISTNLKFEKVLNGFGGGISASLLQKLKADPDVLFVEPDYVVTAFARQPAQSLPTGINRIDAELNPLADIDGTDERVNVDVAVIDTGIDLTHPDLNVYKNMNIIRPSRNANDDNGHGSHVAGTIGAKDNGIGAVGVAPGARLWAVKVLDSRGSGTMSNIIKGIDYVTQHANEIEVANMSLGCKCTSTALNQALTNSIAAGVTYVVAAGNSAEDSTTYSPANHPGVITVSAVADYDGKTGGLGKATCYKDVDDTFANFSNFGAPVDIAAPGVCIYSTWKDNGYSTISGTSMASPHVAGAAALYISHNTKPVNAVGVSAVKAALLSGATLPNLAGGFTGDPDSLKEPLLNASAL